MSPIDLDREKDPDALRAVAKLALEENARLSARIAELVTKLVKAQGGDQAQLKLELEELQRQLDRRNQMLFGKSSEKQPKPKAEKKPKKQSKSKKGRTPQPKLPIEEVFHELDPADQICPSCGEPLNEWQGKHDTCEIVGFEPARFFIRRHVMRKYLCPNGCGIETALGPLKLIPGSRYSVPFTVNAVVSKYADHLPLERQVRIMARAGLVVTSQTLWDLINTLAFRLEAAGAFAALCEEVYGADVIAADETRWPLLNRPNAAAWHMWAATDGKTVIYQIHGNRSNKGGQSLLGSYSGHVITDGYAVYKSLAGRLNITLSNCWAHVRREFVYLQNGFPEETERILTLIGLLYEVERRARRHAEKLAHREGRAPTEEELHAVVRRYRDRISRKVVKQIGRWAVEVQALPASGLAKAIQYMTNRWSALQHFLDNPKLPLDSNMVERTLRGPVVGRKNHYGSRSERGTQVAALYYSLIESAKLVGVDPAAYLNAVAHRLALGERFITPRQYAALVSADA